MKNYLDFEKPIAELETRVAELRETAASSDDIDIDAEVGRLETKSNKLLRDTYAKLTPWQKAQVARHPDRPHFKDPTSRTMSPASPMTSCRWPATARLPMTQRSSADSRGSMGGG